MTSTDTTDTGVGTPPCIRGKGRYEGTPCPGGEACLAARSARLSAAYTAGCRSPGAREANRVKTARNRASGVTPGDDDGWNAPDVPASARELTGELCPECGQPLYWERGRAGQQCDNGHWRIAPNTEERIIATPKREVTRNEKPALIETIRFGVRRDALIHTCETALSEIDVTGIEILCNRLSIGSFGWDSAIVRTYVSGFKTIISHANQAQTYSQLDECEQTFRQLHDQIEYNSLLTSIRQSVSDVAQRLDYTARQNNAPTGYRVIPNTYTIEEYERGNPLQNSYGTGSPIGTAKRRAITTGSVIRETATVNDDDEDEDEDENEDEDYDYVSYYSPTSGASGGGISPTVIGIFLLLGLAFYAYVTVPPWWNREDYRTCGCTNRHTRRPALARYRIDVNYTGIWIDHCGKKKCLAIARQYVTEQNGTGYEVREYELRDQYGNLGSSAEFTGVYKNA